MTPFGKFLNRSLKSLHEEAVKQAFADANVQPGQIECVFFANAGAGVVTGQEMIRAQPSLRNTAHANLRWGLLRDPNDRIQGRKAFADKRTSNYSGD